MKLKVMWLIATSILVTQSYGGVVSNSTTAQPTTLLDSWFVNDGTISRALSEPRIVGGDNAKEGDFPYQVQVITRINDQEVLVCGGALLTGRFIVTAAHCIYGNEVNTIRIYAGTLKLMEVTAVTVKNRHIHPSYNYQTYINDIALLELWDELPTGNKNIAAIGLREDNITPGSCCVVSGWGKEHEQDYDASDHLKYVSVPIVANSECSSLLQQSILPQQICAGYEKGGKDSCQGDSGGPLVCDGLLTGIVSVGIGCAHENSPGVYTNVYAYTSWLKRTMGSSYPPRSFYNSNIKPNCSFGNPSSSISNVVILLASLILILNCGIYSV